jgi:hypothetical protein
MQNFVRYAAVLVALAACSKDKAKPAAGAGSAASPHSGDSAGDPCDVISAADVAGIIISPVTRAKGLGPNTCVYRAASFANITLAEASGDDAKGAWKFAHDYGGPQTPVTGIGDEAIRNNNGTILVARKGDRSCRVDVVGYDNSAAKDSITPARDDELAHKLGALCTKLFAAR